MTLKHRLYLHLMCELRCLLDFECIAADFSGIVKSAHRQNTLLHPCAKLAASSGVTCADDCASLSPEYSAQSSSVAGETISIGHPPSPGSSMAGEGLCPFPSSSYQFLFSQRRHDLSVVVSCCIQLLVVIPAVSVVQINS